MTLAAALVLATLAGSPQASDTEAKASEAKVSAPARPAVRSTGAARAAPGEGPVRVDADEVHYVFQRREVVFTGKPVVLTRQDARLTCEKLVAKNDARGQIAQAVCSGDVRFARGTRIVTCERATYEAAAARLVCEGDPVLKDGPSEARGRRLVYDLRADEARLEGAKIVLPGGEVDARRRELEERRKGGSP
jgi:lipopolysaccharide export system protein LptA